MCSRGTGLDVWFDKDDLQPSEPRTAALENAVGRALARFRIIPVLTDGAGLVALSPFLQQHQCVDPGDASGAAVAIRRWLESQRGVAEERSIAAACWATHSPFRGPQVFQAEDSWLFFGQDEGTEELLGEWTGRPRW